MTKNKFNFKWSQLGLWSIQALRGYSSYTRNSIFHLYVLVVKDGYHVPDLALCSEENETDGR